MQAPAAPDAAGDSERSRSPESIASEPQASPESDRPDTGESQEAVLKSETSGEEGQPAEDPREEPEMPASGEPEPEIEIDPEKPDPEEAPEVVPQPPEPEIEPEPEPTPEREEPSSQSVSAGELKAEEPTEPPDPSADPVEVDSNESSQPDSVENRDESLSSDDSEAELPESDDLRDEPAPPEIEPEPESPPEGEEPAGESISAEELLAADSTSAAAVEEARLQAVIEAVIYITEEPLTLSQIAAAVQQPRETVVRLMEQLVAEYERPEHGLVIREIAGGFKMATKPEHHEAVRAFVKSLKPPLKLSLAALETLAVIAYKQPITAPEIMEIRGVQGAGVLKTLLERKLIATAGRKNVIGRPVLYKTTKEFLVQFGLRDLTELPSLKEFEELRRLALPDDEPGPPVEAQPLETPVTVPSESDEPGEKSEPSDA